MIARVHPDGTVEDLGADAVAALRDWRGTTSEALTTALRAGAVSALFELGRGAHRTPQGPIPVPRPSPAVRQPVAPLSRPRPATAPWSDEELGTDGLEEPEPLPTLFPPSGAKVSPPDRGARRPNVSSRPPLASPEHGPVRGVAGGVGIG